MKHVGCGADQDPFEFTAEQSHVSELQVAGEGAWASAAVRVYSWDRELDVYVCLVLLVRFQQVYGVGEYSDVAWLDAQLP
jgi:hypothetical protein